MADEPPQRMMRRPLVGLRIVVAALLVIHGVARLTLGIVDDFGAFLGAAGFPLGGTIAWAVTLFELVGGSVLAWGRFVRPLAAFFVIELLAGVALVHAREGWFVVGAGRNGVEYSVLLVAVLLAVAWDASPRTGESPDQ